MAICYACLLMPCRSLASADEYSTLYHIPESAAVRASRTCRIFTPNARCAATTRARDQCPNNLNYDSRVQSVLEDIRAEKYLSFREAASVGVSKGPEPTDMFLLFILCCLGRTAPLP